MIGNLGTSELLIIAAILILLFGAKRLPMIGRGLGEGIGSFVRELRRLGKSRSDEQQKIPDIVD